MKPRPEPIPSWLRGRIERHESGLFSRIGHHALKEDHFSWEILGARSFTTDVKCLACGWLCEISSRHLK